MIKERIAFVLLTLLAVSCSRETASVGVAAPLPDPQAPLSLSTPVEDVLLLLGETAPRHRIASSPQMIEAGRRIVVTGEAEGPQGQTPGRVSKFFRCVDCHNTSVEDADLVGGDSESRLDFVAGRDLALLPGTTLAGVSDRVSWYNGDYLKKYGERLLKTARTDLAEATQVCAEHCSQGRRLETWELEAVLAYYRSIALNLNDLGLAQSDLAELESVIRGNDEAGKQQAVSRLRDQFSQASPATFVEAPENLESGYGEGGDADRGQLLLEKSCVHCHRDEGPASPNLSDPSRARAKLASRFRSEDPKRNPYVLLREGTKPGGLRKSAYMPHYPSERMSNALVDDLRAWALGGDNQSGGSDGTTQSPSDSGPRGTVAVSLVTPTDLEEKLLDLFAQRCTACHSVGADEDKRQLPYLATPSDLQTLRLDRDRVKIGNSKASVLYSVLEDGDMPRGKYKDFDEAELELVAKWIDGTAEDVPAREPIPFSTVTRRVLEDLKQTQSSERRFVRYLTLTNLHNVVDVETGQPADSNESMDLYRAAVGKLVNSLSWADTIVAPRAIDPEETIFRIDLRDYKWTADHSGRGDLWETLVSFYPYGIDHRGDADLAFIQEETYSRQPILRADWFAFATAQEPGYSMMLGLPRGKNALGQLEHRLGVDRVENIRKGDIHRAGFENSGVSKANRLVERHAMGAGRGAYWISYDFSRQQRGNQGRGPNLGSLKEAPFGPPEAHIEGRGARFEYEGGEVIFNLRNGLQAYLLTTGKGESLDQAPTSVVSDEGALGLPLGAVVLNGISCMGCHSEGIRSSPDQSMKTFRDEIGPLIRDADPRLVERLYQTHKPEEIGELARRDQVRFNEATKLAMGKYLPSTEPITALFKRFDEPVGEDAFLSEFLELGSQSLLDRLQDEARTNHEMDRILRDLGGRGIPRENFLRNFQVVVQALNLRPSDHRFLPYECYFFGEENERLFADGHVVRAAKRVDSYSPESVVKIALPWGGEVRARLTGNSRIRVQRDPSGKTPPRADEKVALELTSTARAHVVVYIQEPEGTHLLALPNDRQKQNVLQPHRSIQLPDPALGYAIVQDRPGPYAFHLFVSEQGFEEIPSLETGQLFRNSGRLRLRARPDSHSRTTSGPPLVLEGKIEFRVSRD